MKCFIVLAAVISCVLSAPTDETRILSSARLKKSYGSAPPSYGPAPCASAPAPAPIALYLAAAPQPGPAPHYREDEHVHEGHMEARSDYGPIAAPAGLSYPAPAPSASYSAPALSASYSAPAASIGSDAVGIFPNAKVGGCAIPILLSCSPNVVSGQLAKSHSYGAPAYRSHESHMRQTEKEAEAPVKGWKEAEAPAKGWKEAEMPVKTVKEAEVPAKGWSEAQRDAGVKPKPGM